MSLGAWPIISWGILNALFRNRLCIRMSIESSVATPRARPSLETWNVWVLLATVGVALVMVVPGLAVPGVITKTFLLAAGTLLTLILFIVARLSRGNIVLPPLALVGALWLPALAYVCSAAFSGISFAQALWGISLEIDTLGLVLAVTVLGTLTALIVRRREQYQAVVRASGVLFGVVTLVQLAILVVGQMSPSTVAPGYSIVGSFYDLAIVLGLGVIGALVTLRFIELTTKNKRLLIGVTVGALVLLAAANLSFIWVALGLVSLGLFIEAALMRRPSVDDGELGGVALIEEADVSDRAAPHSMLIALPVLVVAVFFLFGNTLGAALAESLSINMFSVNPSWQATTDVARKVYEQSPVFGSGPGSFGVEWLKYRDAAVNTTVYWNTDFVSGVGVIPTSLATTGLLGALAWILLIGLFVGLGLRMLVRKTPEDSYIRYVAVLSFVSTLYLVAAALFLLPNAIVFGLTFVSAGLFASTMRLAAGAEQRGIIFAKSPRIGFVVVFTLTLVLFAAVMVAYTLVGRYLSLVELTKANSAFRGNDIAQATSLVQRSIAFAPSAVAYQAQANIALVELRQIAASTTLPAAAAQQAFQATLSSGINAALTATRLAPTDYKNWLALGNLYAQAVPLNVSGAYDSAKTAYDRAKELHPTSPEIAYIRAQLHIAGRNTVAAEEELQAAITLKQDYLNAIFLMSQLKVQAGKVQEALDAALAAAYFAPEDPNILFQVGVLRAARQDYVGAAAALEEAVRVNSQFANARYFLAAVYAKQREYAKAVTQLEAVRAFTEGNAEIVDPLIVQLTAGKNPFPANLLTISQSDVPNPTQP